MASLLQHSTHWNFWRWKRGDSYTPPKCQFCCNWPSGETRIDSARDVECWWWRTRLYGLTKLCEQKRKVLLIVSNCMAEEAETCCIGSAHRKSAINMSLAFVGICNRLYSLQQRKSWWSYNDELAASHSRWTNQTPCLDQEWSLNLSSNFGLE